MSQDDVRCSIYPPARRNALPRLPTPERRRLAVLLAVAGALACDGPPSDAELLAPYPEGSIFLSWDTPEIQIDCPVPAFLFGTEPQVARGVSVPYGDPREDGSRSVRRWGLWHYYHAPDDDVSVIPGERVGGIEVGAPSQRGRFRDGERVGTWEFWYPDGSPRAVGSFVDGKLHGEWQVWTPSGALDSEHSGTWRAGVKVD